MNPYFVHIGGAIGALMMLSLSGCQSLATTSHAHPSMSATAAPSVTSPSPALKDMTAIDRTGRIAYIEVTQDKEGIRSAIYITHPDGSDKHKYAEVDGGIYSLAWSDDGRYLTYSIQRGRSYPVIYLYDTVTERTTPIINNKGMNLSGQLSADNTTLMYTSSDEGETCVYEYDMATGTRRPAINTEWSNSLQPKYLPNGDIVFVSDKGVNNRPRLYRYDRDARTVAQITTSGYATSPSISHDGQLMSYLAGHNAAIMDLNTGKEIADFGSTGLEETAKLSPSTDYVIYPMRTPNDAPSSAANDAPIASQLFIRPLVGEGAPFSLVSSQGVLRDPVWGVMPSVAAKNKPAIKVITKNNP
ncbi:MULTISPECIES: TolB family protein [unclassified Psychrobacter]|uniref:TolB family protein n=1 Tax=unclassified Psychrobacter TaxID=196806 RepID=UPI0018F2D84A|nr:MULTISPECIES: PD40 domain-containing protein [unclassified Psychrobacter]